MTPVGMKRLAAVLAVAGAGLALSGGPASAGSEPAATVTAHGNIFTDNLGYTPIDVAVRVGDTVAWQNTDSVAPHTVTEDHGLFDLTGDDVPGFPGFGPGKTRTLRFAGGTFHYYCQVHGKPAMHGVVRVPDKVRRSGKRVVVRWASAKPPAGQVFDVQRRSGGHWMLVERATVELSGKFPATGGKFRSRQRLADDATEASAWSPPAGP